MYVRGYLQGSENGRVVTIDSGEAADIEEFRSLVTREKGDNCKNRHGATVILHIQTSK